MITRFHQILKCTSIKEIKSTVYLSPSAVVLFLINSQNANYFWLVKMSVLEHFWQCRGITYPKIHSFIKKSLRDGNCTRQRLPSSCLSWTRTLPLYWRSRFHSLEYILFFLTERNKNKIYESYHINEMSMEVSEWRTISYLKKYIKSNCCTYILNLCSCRIFNSLKS